MDFLKRFTFAILFLGLCSCQIGYLSKSAYYQMQLLYKRDPIEKALQSDKITSEDKEKLQLALKAREFAEQDLHLKPTKNYTSYVQLDQPYVTYVVSAAPKWKFEHHLFHYPVVGSMPYKGFFKEADALDFQSELKAENLDTYMRGVSAYSTLGWFNDPVLSSMLRYKNHDLVNTIIHETVHATLYIKHEADFNERMAVFIGNKGTELFYLKNEGTNSATLKTIRDDNLDDKVFSEFISQELKSLEDWYKQQTLQNEDARKERLQLIQQKFKSNVQPKLKTTNYNKFAEIELNNARLLIYKTYFQDLSDFEALYIKLEKNFDALVRNCKSLENQEDPQTGLKRLLN